MRKATVSCLRGRGPLAVGVVVRQELFGVGASEIAVEDGKIDRREDMQFFLELGVDALITKRVAELVELLERVC